MRLPILQLSSTLFWQSITSHHITQVFLRLLAFPKAKIAVEMAEICECEGQKVQKLSQRRLTAD